MKYRKRPVVIDAWQNKGTPMAHQTDDRPKWLVAAIFADNIRFRADDFGFITIEGGGWVPFSPGDWIIKGVKGEIYPCTDAVFQETYEAVPEPGTRTCSACIGLGYVIRGVNKIHCTSCGGTGRVRIET